MRTFSGWKTAILFTLIAGLALPAVAVQQDKPLSQRDARRYIEAAEDALKDEDPAKAGGL